MAVHLIFLEALSPTQAESLHNLFVECLSKEETYVQAGKFGVDMQTTLVNNGPMTFLIESRNVPVKLHNVSTGSPKHVVISNYHYNHK